MQCLNIPCSGDGLRNGCARTGLKLSIIYFVCVFLPFLPKSFFAIVDAHEIEPPVTRLSSTSSSPHGVDSVSVFAFLHTQGPFLFHTFM